MSVFRTDKFKLFITGFLQVFFVSVNTYFISKTYYLGVLVSSFMINIIWTYNVKKVAFGGFLDKMIYAIGATMGALLGLFLGRLIF